MGMTRAMNTLILTRAHYRRRYGNDAPEMSIPSRFLEEVPSQLDRESRRPLAGVVHTELWNGADRVTAQAGGKITGEVDGRHYNYEDESQEVTRISGADSRPKGKSPEGSIDNIARFFGGKGVKPGSFARPTSRPKMDIPEPTGAAGLKKGQRVRHANMAKGRS